MILVFAGTVLKIFNAALNFIMFRYYPALKTLEQLEHTYLARIKK